MTSDTGHRNRLNRYLDLRIPSLSLAGSFGNFLDPAVLECIPWRIGDYPRCRVAIKPVPRLLLQEGTELE